MRAARLVAAGEVAVARVPVPEPAAGEVLVRLEGSGVCGSNVPVWEGRPWFEYPLAAGAPGHEGWGIVESVGDAVDGVAPGDRVAAVSYRAFGEYDVAKADQVVPLPPQLAGRPFPGEALGCAVNVFARCGVRPGDTVAVVGTGFLGLLVVQLAARAGAEVVAVSRRDVALEAARAAGATIGVRPDRVEGEFDVVVEAAGVQETLDLATRLTRESGRLVIAGYHQDGPRSVNMQLWNWRGLDVVNAHERDERANIAGIRSAVDAVVAGQLDPEPLYTHVLPLDRVADALELARTRPDGFLKALVTT
jgi:2-desacetyl-2-hydroxyethyl bacteriochlorophyllide A dehydrogenase